MNSQTNREAVLALADGTIFRGVAIGASGLSVGEVVFNTALTGYQEILTDTLEMLERILMMRNQIPSGQQGLLSEICRYWLQIFAVNAG